MKLSIFIPIALLFALFASYGLATAAPPASLAAITQTDLTKGEDASNTTVYTSAPITPTANSLILVAVDGIKSSGTPPQPVITGNGLTYVFIGRADHDTSGQVASIFLFRAMGASPSAGVVTFTFSNTMAGNIWIIDEYDNIDTSGSNGSGAIVQNDTNTAFGLAVSSTLAAFGDASTNATFTTGAYDEDDETLTADGSLVLLNTSESVAEHDEMGTAWLLGVDLTPSWTITGPGDENLGVVSIEIKGEDAGAGGGRRRILLLAALEGYRRLD